jgi:hypothetical protein
MELITFDHLDSEASILEYKLNNKTTAHNLTNVAEHLSDIYKFKKPAKGTEKDKFIIKYSGNKKATNEDQDVAHYVLIKEKEASRYLITVDLFNLLFSQII